VRAAEARGLKLEEVGEVESLTGFGIRSTIDGDNVFIGRVGMFSDSLQNGSAATVPQQITSAVEMLEQNGRSTAVVRRVQIAPAGSAAASGGFLGVIGIADEPRASAKDSVAQLRQLGIKHVVMLTGDNAGIGNAVGKAVGIDEVKAGLLPEDKVTAIKALAGNGRVAMVGDGVNDAPALAHAAVGIAMGAAGTAAALETADVALMGEDLSRLGFAIGLSRAARRIIRQNLYISIGVIGVLVIASLSGTVGMSSAIVFHEGSTLVVIVNALRLLAFK
jgi:Cd2+/Zn2+-exporting ATPase